MRSQPALEETVDRFGADQAAAVRLPSGRRKDEGLGLIAAKPSVTADQFLESGDLVAFRYADAVHENVGCVRKPAGSTQMIGRVSPVISQRIFAFHPSVLQIASPGGAYGDGAVLH